VCSIYAHETSTGKWQRQRRAAASLPFGQANSSCIEHFATFSQKTQQVNSRSLGQMSKSVGLKRQPAKKFLFLLLVRFGVVWETCNFAHGGSIEMSAKTMRQHIQFLPRPTELATRLGQLRWPSYEAAPGGVECLVCGVWKGAVAPRRRLLPMHMKVSFVGYMHFPTCQQIATMAKGNCNMQHRRRSPIRVSNDVAQWGK